MSMIVLVIDDEPDVEVLFRQQFRRDLRAGRFNMEFSRSAPEALQGISNARDVRLILILSACTLPVMPSLDLLPQPKSLRLFFLFFFFPSYCDDETKRRALEGG